MLRKIRSSRLREVVSYMLGGDPRDEWEFEVGTKLCRFLNGWRSGAKLMVDGLEVARNDQPISVGGQEPFISAEVRDGNVRPWRVDVYVRAIFGVKIHVRIDGRPLNDGFL